MMSLLEFYPQHGIEIYTAKINLSIGAKADQVIRVMDLNRIGHCFFFRIYLVKECCGYHLEKFQRS